VILRRGKPLARGRYKEAFGIGFVATFGIILALVIASVFLQLPIFQPHSSVQENTPTAPTTPSSLPLKVYISDGIQGGAVDGTLYILDPSTYKVLETITTQNGIGTSQKPYGDQVMIYFVASGYVAKPLLFDPSQAKVVSLYGQDFYQVDLIAYKEPLETDLQLTVFDELGNIVASETTGNTIAKTNNQVDLTLQITVASGTAVINYFDPLNEENDDWVLVFRMNDTLASLSIGQRVEYGGYVYYIVSISDIISQIDKPAISRLDFSIFYGGASKLSVDIFVYNNVDPSLFANSLVADSDTTVSDSVATFIVQ